MWFKCLVAGGLLGVACCLAAAAPADDPQADSAAPPTTAPTAETQPTSQPTSRPKASEKPASRIPSVLKVHELDVELGFEASYDQREARFEAADRFQWTYHQSNRARRFEETIGFKSSGALFDEKVLLYDAGLRFGLTQERFSETRPGPDRDENPHGDLLEYDLNLTYLPRGKISGNVFAQKLDTRVPRAFQPSLDRERERYGASLYYNDAHFPMRFTFEHVWDEFTSRTFDLLDDERRGRDTFRYEGTWQIDKHHSLRLEYQYDDRSERYAGSDTRFDTTRNYVILNHILRFGKDHRSSWENLARFQDESGDLARDTAEVSTRLRLQHTKQLSTNFAAQFLRDSFQELTTTSWRGEGGVTYQHDDWLTTSLQFYGLQHQADENADYFEWGSLANISASHENPWGRLTANLSYNHTNTDTRNGGRRGVVIGESVTFRDPLPAYLVQPDVDRASIVITDANRSRTYIAGRDYVAVPMGPYTALHRVATGAIADRQTVLVSYTYRSFGDYDVCRDRVDFRIQQRFKFGLTPYYALSIQDEDLDRPRYLTWRARNVNRHRIGATYQQPRWSVGCEYEYNDDAIDPYQALHANGDVVIWQTSRNQLDGKTTLSQFWFDGSNGLRSGLRKRDAFLLDAGLAYRHVLARDFEANAAAMYRYEDDSLYGDTHGVDLSAGLEWRIGYFSLLLETEYDVLDLPDSRDNSFAVWLKLKREIPIIDRRPRR